MERNISSGHPEFTMVNSCSRCYWKGSRRRLEEKMGQTCVVRKVTLSCQEVCCLREKITSFCLSSRFYKYITFFITLRGRKSRINVSRLDITKTEEVLSLQSCGRLCHPVAGTVTITEGSCRDDKHCHSRPQTIAVNVVENSSVFLSLNICRRQ